MFSWKNVAERKKRVVLSLASFFCAFASIVSINWLVSSTNVGLVDGCAQVIRKRSLGTDDKNILFHIQCEETNPERIKEFQNYYFGGLKNLDFYSFQYSNRLVMNPELSGHADQMVGLGGYSEKAYCLGLQVSSTLKEKDGFHPLESTALDTYFSYQDVLKVVHTAGGESLIVSDEYASRLLESAEYATYLAKRGLSPTDGTFWSLIGKTVPISYYDRGELLHRNYVIYNVFSLSRRDGPRIKSLYGPGAVLSYKLGNDAGLYFKGMDFDLGKSNLFNSRFMSAVSGSLSKLNCVYSFWSLKNGELIEEPEIRNLFLRAFFSGSDSLMVGLSAPFAAVFFAGSIVLAIFAVKEQRKRPYYLLVGFSASYLMAEGMWLVLSLLAPFSAFMTTLGGIASLAATSLIAVNVFGISKRIRAE